MSCSLCCLPFIASPRSIAPRPPPPGLLTDKQLNYLQWGVVITQTVPGSCIPMEYLDGNMFGNMGNIPMVINVTWESDGTTVVALHTVCATILRHLLNVSDNSPESIAELCAVDRVLGRPQGGPNAGRFCHVDYEGFGEDNIDIHPFWIVQDEPGMNVFNWTAFKASGHDWAFSRPDVFPKFHTTVSPTRLASVGPPPESSTDIITTQPLDILHVLLSYLSNKAFFALLSTCRLLRHHALTTFQSHARERVLALGWAIPLPSEHAAAARTKTKDGRPASALMATAAESPVDGDWLLYLSQVHRTPGMRARRRLWALGGELRRAYLERKPGSEYADIVDGQGNHKKSPKRLELEAWMSQMNFMTRALNRGK